MKFPALKVLRIPKRVSVGISYDSSHYGPKPTGGNEPCNAKSAGCYYDSLNVGLAEAEEGLLTVGADPTEPYIDLANQGAVDAVGCGNDELLGKLALDACPAFWEDGDHPLIAVTAH